MFRSRRGPARWLIAVAAGFAVVLGALLWYQRSATGVAIAHIDQLAGMVMLQRGDVERPAAERMALQASDRLTTADGGQVMVSFTDGTTVRLSAAGVLEIRSGRADTAKVLRLERGILIAEVAKQPSGWPMRLVTPVAEAVVVGTRLQLAHADAATRLEVTEGVVQLARANERVTVAAGHFSEARDGAELSVHPLVPGAPSTARSADRTTIVSFDFEDGHLPPVWRRGRIEPGPARAGNRYCLVGADGPDVEWTIVQLHAEDGLLFTYENDIEVSFDYWVDEQVKTIDLYLWNASQDLAFGEIFLSNLTHRAWTRASARIHGWTCPSAPSASLRIGDRIQELAMQSGQLDGVLYVDNVRIERVQAPSPPRSDIPSVPQNSPTGNLP